MPESFPYLMIARTPASLKNARAPQPDRRLPAPALRIAQHLHAALALYLEIQNTHRPLFSFASAESIGPGVKTGIGRRNKRPGGLSAAGERWTKVAHDEGQKSGGRQWRPRNRLSAAEVPRTDRHLPPGARGYGPTPAPCGRGGTAAEDMFDPYRPSFASTTSRRWSVNGERPIMPRSSPVRSRTLTPWASSSLPPTTSM
jgi:hypothetical protein